MRTYKSYLLLAFSAVIVFSLFVAFRSCDDTEMLNKLPSPTKNLESTRKLDSLTKANIELKAIRDLMADTIKNLLTEKSQTERLMKRADKELKKFIAKSNQAKSNGDVSAELDACDSLKHAVVEARGLVINYQNGMNELIEAWSRDNSYCQQQIDIEKNKVEVLEADKSSLEIELLSVTGKYNQLANDYNKQVKKKKRERTLSRVLSMILLGAAAGFAITN